MTDPTLLIWQFLDWSWPGWLFLALVPIFTKAWLYWRSRIFIASSRMVLLELRMPREIAKSPRAMEQVLVSIHALRNAAGDFGEVWVDGEITRSFSLEVVSFGGEIHFYVRCYYKVRPLVEAAFFSYYQDIELVEVEDYTERFPASVNEMEAQGYNLYSCELALVKDPALPIRWYDEFESPDEAKEYDPVASLIETFGKTQKDQIIALQFVITPLGPEWRKGREPYLQKLREEAGGGKQALAKKTARRNWDFSLGPLPALRVEEKGAKEDNPFKPFLRTPGEVDTIEAVEKNLAMPAFDTIIRFLYFSPKETYYDSFPKRGIIGSLNQYASLGLNAFWANVKTITLTKYVVKPYIFPALRASLKKQRALAYYKERRPAPIMFLEKLMNSHPLNWNFASKGLILTTKSLATVFHPPTRHVLTAPHVKRLESKKAGPPAGLAIFGEEEGIEQYQ
ncbi:MAG TPA: hypothetical protein VMC43_02310 [Candidatus Paceibacterota bacterium]|nr:hypothetical protein [Candidatus Paceibacterota bacterium]